MPHDSSLDRRRFLAFLSTAGLSGTLFPGVLWARVQDEGGDTSSITTDTVKEAERIAGLSFEEDEREMLVRGLRRQVASFQQLRELEIPNEVPPALHFDPAPPGIPLPPPGVERLRPSRGEEPILPDSEEEIAFLPVTELARLIRSRQISSVELTRIYLARLEKYDPLLKCVVTRTDEQALRQALRADQELSSGKVRGPLHGIPWGAKDLLATREHRTTWGAEPYREQRIYQDATVVRRLADAGAVLVAKLTLGALAMGDRWYGGMTRCPWNPEVGSSGSSAGPGSAVAAGLVGFALGTETRGSIVSPSVRNGNSSLRPTFGRVSRAGAMALSWSMDKIGPMCRSAEDCALVFAAIHGADDLDPTSTSVPFDWDGDRKLEGLRIGFLEGAFEGGGRGGNPAQDQETLRVLREVLDLQLMAVTLPDFPTEAMSFILTAEAAAAFDQLTLGDQDDQLSQQGRNAWPNFFRTARLIPAVEYIQANRARTIYMRRLAESLGEIDLFVTPPFGGGVVGATNLTGHPQVTVPHGFDDKGMPTSISFVGGLHRDAEALLVAHAFQRVTDHHRRHPELEV